MNKVWSFSFLLFYIKFSFNFEFQIKICDENQALVPIPAFDGLVAIWRVFSETFEVSVTSSLICTYFDKFVCSFEVLGAMKMKSDFRLILTWYDRIANPNVLGFFSDSAVWRNFSSVFIGKSRHEGSSRLWMKLLFHGKDY